MLKIFDGEVTIIQEEFYKNNLLDIVSFCLSMPYPEKTYFLVKDGEEVLGALSYRTIVGRRPILYKVFEFQKDVMHKAREYFEMMEDKQDGDCVPVCDAEGNVQFIIVYYAEGVANPGQKILVDMDLERDEETLDYTLLNRFDGYIFYEMDDYSIEIAQLIQRRFPEKKCYFLDKAAAYFFCEKDIYKSIYHIMDLPEWNEKRFLHGYSKKLKCQSASPLEQITNCYASYEIMGSLIWSCKVQHFGDENPNKTIYLMDFSTHHSGLVDIMRFVCIHVILAEERGWIPYVYLNRQPNKYLMSDDDNMWEYFFENFSDLTIEEIRKSKNVISVFNNGNVWTNLSTNPYVQEVQGRLFSFDPNAIDVKGEFKKKIVLKKTVEERMKSMLPFGFGESRILGVLARGTDYRKEACESRGEAFSIRSMNSLKKYIHQAIYLWNYSKIFVMTEDGEFYDELKSEFGEDMLSIHQERVYYSSDKQKKEYILNMMNIKDVYEHGLNYFASIYALSRCNGLLANSPTGAYFVAESWNEGKYEYNQVIVD